MTLHSSFEKPYITEKNYLGNSSLVTMTCVFVVLGRLVFVSCLTFCTMGLVPMLVDHVLTSLHTKFGQLLLYVLHFLSRGMVCIQPAWFRTEVEDGLSGVLPDNLPPGKLVKPFSMLPVVLRNPCDSYLLLQGGQSPGP